jgi:hypothetical protein
MDRGNVNAKEVGAIRPMTPVGERLARRVEDITDRVYSLRTRLGVGVDAIVGSAPRPGDSKSGGGPSSVPNGVHDRLKLLDEALASLEDEIARLED